MSKRRKISVALIASFTLILAMSYWLQSQLIPESILSLDNCKIEVPHSSSAILNLVRESLEDSENRKTGLNSESHLAEQSYCITLETIKSFLYLEVFQPGLVRSNIYLDHRQLLI